MDEINETITDASIEFTKLGERVARVTYHFNTIKTITVERKYRRQGYGSRILRRAEEQIKRRGTLIIIY